MYLNECEEVSFRPLPGPLWILSQTRAFEVIASRVDVLHEPFLGIVKPLAVPTVVTIHDLIPILFPQMVPRAFRFYFQHVLPTVLDHSDAVIADSQTTADDLVRICGVPRSKVYVVHLGSDHIAATQASDDRGSGAPLPPARRYFLVVGTGPSKRVEDAIEAFAAAHGDLPPGIELRIVGRPGGPAKAALKGWRGAPERVVFIEQISRERLAALYRGAEAVVHSAMYEGFGLVPLEAMRSGVPVISTNGGALAEVSNSAVMQVPVGGIDQLSKAMVDVMEPSHRRTLVAAGHRHARKFTWATTADKTIQVYRRVVGKDAEDWTEQLRQSAGPVSA